VSAARPLTEFWAEYQKQWQEDNKEWYRAWYAEYYEQNKHEYARRCKERRARERQATPAWYESEKFKVKELYDLCRQLESITGEDFEVDHIIPVMGKNVCGLHCYDNLQPMPASMNRSKRDDEKYTGYLDWLDDFNLPLFSPVSFESARDGHK